MYILGQHVDALKCYLCIDCDDVDSATQIESLEGVGTCKSCVKSDTDGGKIIQGVDQSNKNTC